MPTRLVVLSNTNRVIGVDLGIGTGDYSLNWGTTSGMAFEADLASDNFGYSASLESVPGVGISTPIPVPSLKPA